MTGALGGDFATVKYRQIPPQRFVRGDCNNDGHIDGLTDAVFLLSYEYFGAGAPRCRAACDVNLSGVTDAIDLLVFSFLGGPAPVPPFPDCGPPGPRDPRLGCALEPDVCR